MQLNIELPGTACELLQMQRRAWVLFCLSCMAASSTSTRFTHRKRQNSEGTSEESHPQQEGSHRVRKMAAAVAAEWQAVLRKVHAHLVLQSPALVFHMDNPSGRNALIDALWSGEFVNSMGRFTKMNPLLISLFETLSDDNPGAVPRLKDTLIPRFEGVLSILTRVRSQKRIPIEHAVLSVVFLHYSVRHFVWQAVAKLTRAVMSRSWTVQLCEDALLRDPGPPYKTASGMTGAVFDNFMMKVGYGSYATHESKARRFEMTNWASVFLPSNSVSDNFNIQTMLGNGGMFRDDLALSDFLDLFSPVNMDIMNNKRQRWSQFLDRAIDGTLWTKDVYDSPYPPTHFHWHDPIMDRLQSSYDDVNFELDLMRRSNYHRYSNCIQIGGDGLSYQRLIHRLAQDPQQYLYTTPVVIPRLGAFTQPQPAWFLTHLTINDLTRITIAPNCQFELRNALDVTMMINVSLTCINMHVSPHR